MNRQDFDILADLCESLAQGEQRTGKAGRGVKSLSVISRQVAAFKRKCESGDLKGRERERKGHKLFLSMMRSANGAE